ncbi:hypothetical protein B0H14DRAFT_2589095 [Mycena olivaceomarginata]|nr:hypothetical protein B0H14DRAFT_2589095 [Mycena olivaceomarginata]
MRVLYLLWNAFFCLGMLLSVLKRHDTPSTSIPSAPCLVTMGDALAGVPAADFKELKNMGINEAIDLLDLSDTAKPAVLLGLDLWLWNKYFSHNSWYTPSKYFKHTSVVPKIEFTHKHVGGSHHSRFSVAEVVPYHTGEANAWTTENYQVLYVSHGSAELREQFSSDADGILCDVPLRMLAPKLTKAKLQAIASFHGITTPKRCTTEEVKNMVSNHVCTSECPDSLSVFERVPDRSSVEHRRKNGPRFGHELARHLN